ncbi:MAG: hypothetical protein ACC660_00345 [Acidimicrobiales bacterium]
MTPTGQTQIRERMAATVSALAVGIPTFGGACAGCLGVAVGAAALAPLSGLSGAWQLLAVMSVSVTVTAVTTRAGTLSLPMRVVAILRAAISAALIYVGVMAIVTVVSALTAGGTTTGPLLP